MAPSLTSPMSPISRVTQNKQLRRMVPVIPAIPRSLEKRNPKEEVSNREGIRNETTIRPNSPTGKQESEEETVVAQAQVPQNGAFNGFGAKDDVEEGGMQDAVVRVLNNARSEKKVAEGKPSLQSKQTKADDPSSRWQQSISNPSSRFQHRGTWISSTSAFLSEAVSTPGHLHRLLLCE